MKTLIVFYSRTGTTKKVAESMAQKLGADLEEIRDTVDRKGIKGYFISGRDAYKRRLTKLEAQKNNPADYDLVIIGTPVWAGNMSVPVRTYLTEQKDNLKNKVAFFCTRGGTKEGKEFLEMEGLIGKAPLATIGIRTAEVVKNCHMADVDIFLAKISGNN